uniref:Nucleoporin SEH1 n=1 Tax=Acrobeloides nanus TaxID=290746 RepID=A0A914C3Z8_9BILA
MNTIINATTKETHGGAVWKVRWAHPTFGQILATCSFDNTVHIFEETVPDTSDQSLSRTGVQSGKFDSSNRWRRRRALTDSGSNVTDIQFAPHFLGLMIATCNALGKVIIYEAEDVLDLDNWTIVFEGEVFKHRCGSLSWSTNRYRHSDLTIKESFGELTDQVTYVCFAPSAGLSFHKLAVAVGARIQIYNIHVHTDENLKSNDHHDYMDYTSLETEKVSVLENGKSQVLRISWNIIGDTISAVYSDGVVRLWKCTFKNNWEVVSVVQPSQENSSKQGVQGIYY